jgi:hypothetical protein
MFLSQSGQSCQPLITYVHHSSTRSTGRSSTRSSTRSARSWSWCPSRSSFRDRCYKVNLLFAALLMTLRISWWPDKPQKSFIAENKISRIFLMYLFAGGVRKFGSLRKTFFYVCSDFEKLRFVAKFNPFIFNTTNQSSFQLPKAYSQVWDKNSFFKQFFSQVHNAKAYYIQKIVPKSGDFIALAPSCLSARGRFGRRWCCSRTWAAAAPLCWRRQAGWPGVDVRIQFSAIFANFQQIFLGNTCHNGGKYTKNTKNMYTKLPWH